MQAVAAFFIYETLGFLVDQALTIDSNPNPDSMATCKNTSFYASIPQLTEGTKPTTREGWTTLLQDLYELLKASHVTVPYTSEDHNKEDPDVWYALGILDQDPNNASNVLSIYNYNESMPWLLHGKINGYNNSLGWNREHVLCQSYGIQVRLLPQTIHAYTHACMHIYIYIYIYTF